MMMMKEKKKKMMIMMKKLYENSWTCKSTFRNAELFTVMVNSVSDSFRSVRN